MKKGRTPKTYRCEQCGSMYLGCPFVYGRNNKEKKNLVLMFCCNSCKDNLIPLGRDRKRKSNKIEDLEKNTIKKYSKIPKMDLVCEKCGKEFHGKKMTFTKKVKRNFVSTEICLCHDCQKEYLQNPEILNNI